MQVDLGRISNNQLVVSHVSFFSCRRFLIGFVHCPVTVRAATEIQYAACMFCQHSFASSITRDAFNTPTQKQSFAACPAAVTLGPEMRLNEYRVRWFDEVVVIKFAKRLKGNRFFPIIKLVHTAYKLVPLHVFIGWLPTTSLLWQDSRIQRSSSEIQYGPPNRARWDHKFVKTTDPCFTVNFTRSRAACSKNTH